MSVNEANPTDLGLLRQRITELEAEREEWIITASLYEEKINKFKETIGVLSSENFDLKGEVAKLRKELESRIEDHETRLAKMEQDSSVEQPQNKRFKDQADVPNTVADQPDNTKLEQDSSVVDEQSQDAEDDPIDAFLIEQHKKSIGEVIRQRNREKKLALQLLLEHPQGQGELQRELDVPVDSTDQNTASVTSHERKNGQGLIQEISFGIDSLDSTQDHDSTPLDHVTEISLTSGQEKTNILQNIARLYEKRMN